MPPIPIEPGLDLAGALSASGTIGVGGPLLSLVTVNGDITLNQLP